MYYEDVLKGLNEEGVRYLVVGGVAMVLHGVVRLTVDFDIMLDLAENNLTKFVSVMDKLGYRPKAPVDSKEFIDSTKRSEWKNKKNMRVFSFHNPKKQFELIDVFNENPINFGKAYSNRVEVNAGGLNIPLASIKDLKKLKKMAGRSQDIADINALDDLVEIMKKEKSYEK
ncbi:MAG: hypothetical protein GF334_10500 [Candidatus Altiarchaeales archaeon]|nr:hypothetical protein [Candidatus Altiarchaeales archaeon]